MGPTCAPVRCESDTDCTEGSGCVSASRCVVERAQIGGWASGSVHPDMLQPAEDGSCAEGSCEQARFCMPAAVDEATKDDCGERSEVPVEETQAPATDGLEEADAAAVSPTAPEAPEAPETSTAPLEDEDSGCATAVAGMSAGLAGLLGLVALGRRRP